MKNEKTVLITGASRGIGRACALAFARAGFSLIISCQNSAPELFALAEQLQHDYSISCFATVGNIGDEHYVKRLFGEIAARFKSLDVLINNAGIAHFSLLQELSLAQWQQLLATNLTADFLCCRSCIPLMLQQHCGSIINVSSVWGNTGAALETAYSATKGGVNAFTKALAKELGPSGIRVNAIAFGMIDTDMNNTLSADEKAALQQEIPLGRFGTVTEAAALILDVAVNHPYLTGQIITMDGGWI